MTLEDLISAAAPSHQPSSVRGFRKDIQGLRAVAVTLVVVFHVWPDLLTGGYVGVDVFFVISGYLITSHLLAKPPRGVADLGAFWARRIHRLLPAALTVLVVTAVATRLLAPSTQWAGTAKEIIASALYVQNWMLASSSVDYLAEGEAPSPVQHYWSLSIEEQFYLLWPLLMLAAFFVADRYRRRSTSVVRAVIGGMVVVSLAISVWQTIASPASAYFITPTRMWELAVGGLVATVGSLSATSRGRGLAALVAWAGLAAILVAGTTYTGETPFPGYTALLPVLGTAAVIWAGTQSGASPTGLLRARPVQWLGDVSYSVYLWHWPLIVLLPHASGGSLGILDQVTIIAVTLVLAGLTKTYIEDRYRHPRPGAHLRRSYAAAAAGMAVIAALGSAQIAESTYRTEQASAELANALEGSDPCLGAGALHRGPRECPTDPTAELVPSVDLAAADRSDAYPDGCWTNQPFTARVTCTYGDGPRRVALVGNSHAGHWLPALQILAEKNDWTITTFLVSRCTASDARQRFDTAEMSQNCYDYGQWVQEQTSGDAFDLVITSERQSVPVLGQTMATTGPKAVAGYVTYLRDWAAGGTNILAIKDPTFPGVDVPDCLAENPDDHSACSAPREDWLIDDPLVAAVEKVDLPNVTSVSFDDLVCEPKTCRGANGGVISYFDNSHLSATYVTTMAPYMDKPIAAALNR
ncbi:acyltransferase family protein [Janibacter endophyticus]|uniref:acyltransferase family protein n=1 Tax=Janibacter endophyticus TaxID=2806261 RepID=UPI001F3233E4|nr:acyltransferase family protein [Janibacter endophyticus]